MTHSLKSMTGYGRGAWEGKNHTFQVELKSVNNRFLNVRTRLPETLLRFESVIEKYLREQLNRGSVTCQVQFRTVDTLAGVSREALLSTYRELTDFAREHQIPGEVDLAMLVSLPRFCENGKAEGKMSSDIEAGLVSALKSAVDELVAMRQKEGDSLKCQLENLFQELKTSVSQVEALSEELIPRCQERFRQRLDLLLKDQEFDEVAMARELSLMADRADISEEMARLESHLKQFSEALSCSGPIGRRFDFLTQEINREINTIGSKSNEIEISQLVVSLKTIVEQIREQIQNVE